MRGSGTNLVRPEKGQERSGRLVDPPPHLQEIVGARLHHHAMDHAHVGHELLPYLYTKIDGRKVVGGTQNNEPKKQFGALVRLAHTTVFSRYIGACRASTDPGSVSGLFCVF